ncbi:MAG TPA: hypothetical protein VLB27_04370, partial [candidate division Zixibacteria bacterium]|nr:hypothetical protein [candidate division Zixibacteria bacterium]
MYLKKLFWGALCLTALAVTANADPGIPDTVRASDVQVNPGDHFGYPVYLYNDENLSGGTLGFQWHTGDLVLDSISFAGSVLASVPDGQRPRTINNTEHNVLTGFFTIFDPPVPPGTGIWATFWFSVDAGAADQVVSFDSTKIGPSGDFIVIALAGNETISPQYVTGSITIGSPQSNTAPTIDPIANQVVSEGDTLVVAVNSTDAESTPVLSAQGLTAFMGFSDNGDGTGALEVTPGYDDDGVYPVMVIASDGELADTAAFDVTVSNVNRAPVWGSVPPQSGPEGLAINVTVHAVDPDGPGL